MIIHNGKDYYDSASAYGVDTSVHLVRNNNKSKPDLIVDSFYFPNSWQKNVEYSFYSDRIGCGVVLAMGKAYSFIIVSSEEIYFSIDEFVKNYPNSNVLKDYSWRANDTWDSFSNSQQFYDERVSKFLIDNQMSFCLILPKYSTYMLTAIDANIFSKIEKKHSSKAFCWKNPAFLKDLGFASVVTPFDFFQQTERWTTGVLSNNPSITNLSDKSKIVKAGFDLKTSFRNMK